LAFVKVNVFHENSHESIQPSNQFEQTMRSHFSLPRGVTAACAVAGATAVLNGNCSAGTFIAADYATNATYTSGWSAGQNGGYGFGAWSFNGTVDTNGIADPGAQQAISSASAIGTAWTLYNGPSQPPAGPGISDVGRAITEPGGLQPGQTLEVVLQNPTAYQFYRGFDVLCLNGADNDPAGVGTSAIRVHVFDYFVSNWHIIDAGGNTTPSLSPATTAVAGMKFDLTLTSATNYSLTMTPLSNPSSAYTHTGTLTTNLPINWVNFRLYLGPNTGPNDPADDLEISSMTIAGLTLNIQLVGTNAVLSWPTNALGVNLASSLNLGPAAVWNTNLPSPVVINGQNIVTNPIGNTRQFFRLQ
jgi:hypothetical protein